MTIIENYKKTSHSVLTSFWTLLKSCKTFSKTKIIMTISLLVNSLIATASNCDHHRQRLCPRQGSPLRIIRDTSALSSETLVFPRSEAQTRAPDMWYWWSFVLSISHTHIKTEMNRKAYTITKCLTLGMIHRRRSNLPRSQICDNFHWGPAPSISASGGVEVSWILWWKETQR